MVRSRGAGRPRRRGGIGGEEGLLSGWLAQMLVVLGILGLVIYEAVALGVATVRVDDAAREVARAARDEYRAEQSLVEAEATAEEVARLRNATVVAVDAEGDGLSVTLEKQASTLVVHHIGPIADRVTPTATRRVSLRP